MANNIFDSEHQGTPRISSQQLTRNVQEMSIFVHELTDLKKEIKRGVPIKWGLQLFWSLFCLCAGEIVTASLTQEKFSLKQHICNANGFFQAMLVVSLSMSILLFFIGKFSGSAIDSIDQMLKQHGL